MNLNAALNPSLVLLVGIISSDSISLAIEANQLLILNYYDIEMPYMRKVNMSPSMIFASRTVLFLQKDGTLKPLAIELILPHLGGDQFGATSKMFTPAVTGVEYALWQIAKAFVAINDSGVHQFLSHCFECSILSKRFCILTSVIPMHINALSCKAVSNAGGIVEKTGFSGPLPKELMSISYRDWVKHSQMNLLREEWQLRIQLPNMVYAC
ncbi:Arachidonate 5-lipoxygenase [Datura stramonium]|uniref:Arachidonate 5-lipoxygenase n=1 Tax=Datura stramonium TaxID=4076 RepID=A0ABS8TFM5_DATST|nr:Arachidonate 5-lipoxygenase [Datura stramonium]